MSDKTAIEWADATWNPIRGCSRVSEGCRNCYAEGVAARFSDPGLHYHSLAERTSKGPRWTGKIIFAGEKTLTQPLRWKRPRRIFVNSMSDLFHEDVPDETIDHIFAVMALCPQHIFQVLTPPRWCCSAFAATSCCSAILAATARRRREARRITPRRAPGGRARPRRPPPPANMRRHSMTIFRSDTAPPKGGLDRLCLECGKGHHRRNGTHPAIFCSRPCKAAWSNRRAKRGAEVYDLLMAHRFERAEAQALGAMQAINRLASIFRQEDERQRAKRRSWRPLREVLLDRPAIKTMATQIRAGR